MSYGVQIIDPKASGHDRRWQSVFNGEPCTHRHTERYRAENCGAERDNWPMCRAVNSDGAECLHRAAKFVRLVPLCAAHAKLDVDTSKHRYTGKDRKVCVVGERPTAATAQYLVCEGLPRIRKDGAAWRVVGHAPSYAHARTAADILCDPRLGAACIELDAPGLEFVQ